MTHLNDSMYLQTIESASAKAQLNNKRASTSPFAPSDYARRRDKDLSLKTSDILFARANSTPPTRFTNKEDLSFITVDQPATLIPKQVHRVNDFNLKNHDIEGSQPMKTHVKFNRQLNPLNPIYKLPSVKRPNKPQEYEHLKPPKDILKVDDIIYDENKKLAMERKRNAAIRNPLACDDINHPEDYGDFAIKGFFRSNYQRVIPETHKVDKLNVKDINDEWKFTTRRQINPLSPRYDYEKSVIGRDIGEIEGAKPAPLPRLSNYVKEPLEERKGNHGHAVPNSFPVERRDYRKINYVQDIIGGPPKHYATFHVNTRRQTHPLDPKY